MPMSVSFERRLFPYLAAIARHYGTPFHIYDEKGILEAGERLNRLFSRVPGFREFFAVKAEPNLTILRLMFEKLGFGFDCSSIPELVMARMLGAKPSDIMFTSNNTTLAEFEVALADGGCILNLDDTTMVEKVPGMPELVCFRYNPGPEREGTEIIGKPEEAKYGLRSDQLIDAYRRANELGARRFGLHTMVISNERDYRYMVETITMLLRKVEEITLELGIQFEFINIGGGIGIPYRPEDSPFDLDALAQEAQVLLSRFRGSHGYTPRLYMESGRSVTGPYGVLVTQVVNKMSKHREYVGVDACMSSLMRPAMYDAYHHITVIGPDGKVRKGEQQTVDVVGSLCENNDKFAKQRLLPPVQEGDLLVIHDTGAHGIAMGFNYNGRLRPKELLLRSDGTVELIRREEQVEDYLRTMVDFEPETLKL